MKKTKGSVINKRDGVTDELALLTYSEEEKQQNEINRANAHAAWNGKYLVVPRNIFSKYKLSGNEAIIFAFITGWEADFGRFYWTNQRLSETFNISIHSVSNIVTKLSRKGLICVKLKRKANGGQIRYINLKPAFINCTLQSSESERCRVHNVNGSIQKISNQKISNNSEKTFNNLNEYQRIMTKRFSKNKVF